MAFYVPPCLDGGRLRGLVKAGGGRIATRPGEGEAGRAESPRWSHVQLKIRIEQPKNRSRHKLHLLAWPNKQARKTSEVGKCKSF